MLLVFVAFFVSSARFLKRKKISLQFVAAIKLYEQQNCCNASTNVVCNFSVCMYVLLLPTLKIMQKKKVIIIIIIIIIIITVLLLLFIIIIMGFILPTSHCY